jgi:hypothetical protein
VGLIGTAEHWRFESVGAGADTLAMKSCKKCGGIPEQAIRSDVQAVDERDGLRVRFVDLPVLRCTSCSREWYPHPDFGTHFAEGLSVPTARTKGFFRRSIVCGGCGGDLPGNAASQTLSVTVVAGHGIVVHLEVIGDAYACDGCGQVQLGPTAEVIEVCAQALSCGGVHPE